MTRVRSSAAVALAAILGGGGVTRAQTVVGVPAVREASERGAFVLEVLEAPSEIAFGTMAVNVWATVSSKSAEPVRGVLLVWPRGDRGEERIEMRPLDGAFDSPREDVVATVDTYGWRTDGRRDFEIRVADAHGETKIGGGALSLRHRISTPDLVLFDEAGNALPWLGSGAGGFAPVETVATGPLRGPILADVDGDRLEDLVLSGGFGEIFIYRNRGAGRFDAARSIVASSEIVAAALGDLDGDARPDLVTAGSDRTLEIRLGLSDEPVQTSKLALVPELLEVADVDGRRGGEIVVASLGFDSGDVQVWRRAGGPSGVWAPETRLPQPEGGRGRVRDLAWIAPRGPLCVLSHAPGAAVLESWDLPSDTSGGSESVLLGTATAAGEPLLLVPGRFRRPDGAATCLVVVRGPESTQVYEVRGRALVHRLEVVGSDPMAFAALDLDADGDDDLVTGGDELRIWLQMRTGDFREAGESPYPLDSRVAALVAANLDERGP
ncbi:MAG: FG-GAP repeat domain-containing protein [bacterium]